MRTEQHILHSQTDVSLFCAWAINMDAYVSTSLLLQYIKEMEMKST